MVGCRHRSGSGGLLGLPGQAKALGHYAEKRQQQGGGDNLSLALVRIDPLP